jgi:hypothetical protein
MAMICQIKIVFGLEPGRQDGRLYYVKARPDGVKARKKTIQIAGLNY